MITCECSALVKPLPSALPPSLLADRVSCPRIPHITITIPIPRPPACSNPQAQHACSREARYEGCSMLPCCN